MQQAAEFWDKSAEKYAKSPIADIEAYNYTLGRTRTYLSPDDKILEVGCGTGSTALIFAADVAHITASDLSPNMIKIAAKKAREQGVSNVKFVAADLFDPIIEGGSFDVVLALNLLHLVEDVPSAISHINGLLKPGGTFISKTVCSPGKQTPLKFRLIKAILPLMQLLRMAPYVNFMKISELENIISAQGFKIVETSDSPAPSRYIVAKKT